MTVRHAARPMTGIPAAGIEVRVGFAPSGAPRAAIDADKYRAVAIPLDSPEMVQRLIDDLQEALDHLLSGDAVVIPKGAND